MNTLGEHSFEAEPLIVLRMKGVLEACIESYLLFIVAGC